MLGAPFPIRNTADRGGQEAEDGLSDGTTRGIKSEKTWVPILGSNP